MNALTFEQVKNKLRNGLSLVTIYEDWKKDSTPDIEAIENTKAAMHFAWEEMRKVNITMRRTKEKSE